MKSIPSIVTVTLNPAIDETVFLDELRPGFVNRAECHHRQAGGKGINVSSMLAAYGIETIATGFLGIDNTLPFDEFFNNPLISDEFVRIPGECRTGIKIVTRSGSGTTDINFPGLSPSASEFLTLSKKLSDLVVPGRWFVVAGSLPSSVSPEDFGNMLRMLKSGGAKIAVDTSGPPLRAAMDCGVDLVKPNHHELDEVLRLGLTDMASRTIAALKLQRERVPYVILSMGSDGALFVSPECACMTAAPPADVVSTVGAGDSLLAGYLAAMSTGMNAMDRAALATVFAWSSLENFRREGIIPMEAETRMKRIKVTAL
ncbi:MAG: 1-phosphofructokinase family hexose kinase [Gloeobacteraceae cyanobacterium ES-bin-144]|nr:1-phosphofructokinase family hexose kinase [Verrucomicrobiales bacterium]